MSMPELHLSRPAVVLPDTVVDNDAVIAQVKTEFKGSDTEWETIEFGLRHIDPMGTIVVPALILVTSSLAAGSAMLFGWAKPVPVNFGRLRNPKADMLWVAAAGPLANLAMAIGWALLFRLAVMMPESDYAIPMARIADPRMQINAVLMMLNLLPLPPLDGGRIAVSLLPAGPAYKFARLEPYGFPILLLLLFTGILGDILGPLVAIFRFVLAIVFGL